MTSSSLSMVHEYNLIRLRRSAKALRSPTTASKYIGPALVGCRSASTSRLSRLVIRKFRESSRSDSDGPSRLGAGGRSAESSIAVTTRRLISPVLRHRRRLEMSSVVKVRLGILCWPRAGSTGVRR